HWSQSVHMFSANRPLVNPSDFQGLKIRISGSKIADRYFREVGSIPQIMAFSEVYQALQTGVVDGCENTPSNYLTQKFHEVQKDITVSYHAHLQYAVIVNPNSGMACRPTFASSSTRRWMRRPTTPTRSPSRRMRTRWPRSRSRARPTCTT